MGIRFRKSKKIGPVRINLSGSGVGWSVGGKGFRYTKPAKGKAYTTTSIPGTGISSRRTVEDASPSHPLYQTPPREHRASSGILKPILIGLLIGSILLAVLYFITILPGYTRENMIPPPPDRTSGESTAKTNVDFTAALLADGTSWRGICR